jgi:hypothetical protein
MNNIKYIFLLVLFACGTNSQDARFDVAQNTFEKDLAKYESIWNRFLAGDTSVANENNFQKDVVVVTAQGDLVGIQAIKDFYMNYLNGFSDIEFTILDAFGQGERIVKHWNFKGTHDGDFFSVLPTGKKVDVSELPWLK